MNRDFHNDPKGPFSAELRYLEEQDQGSYANQQGRTGIVSDVRKKYFWEAIVQYQAFCKGLDQTIICTII